MTSPARPAWILLLCAVATGCGDGPKDDEILFELDELFTRADPAADSPSGHNVVAHCSSDGQTWPDASATIAVFQTNTTTQIDIELTQGRPDTLFTAWLRLRGTDPDTGETFGGSPITDLGSTALAPSTDLGVLEEMMNSVGSTEATNAFMTDADGMGTLSVTLDLPMIGGMYPFDNYDPSLEPVATVSAPFASFLVRLASHCTDGLAHGLTQQDRESWFNWSP